VSAAGARVAAIDVGTNSVRLLVGEAAPAGAGSTGLATIDRRMTITRLGQGVDATGRLDPVAIDRTVSVLGDYRRAMDELGVARVRMTATSAARDAANRDDFFTAARSVVGVAPELLSGSQEAALSFIGATAELDPALGPFLVVDLGGGSTEFAYGTSEVADSLSTEMGCVRFTEKYLDHDPPRPEELVAALSVAEAYVDDVRQAIPDVAEARTFVGLAGTITTAAAVEIGLATYDRDAIHHFVLTKDAAEDVFRTLATEPRAQRLTNPGLEEARADVIVGGMCVLVTIMRRLGLDACLVSETDILDGLAMSLLAD
jgi:exopolyphosphatase / guanosine-5'-triphosphate,3'-diphosphate pyrophosphatase